MKHLLRLVVLVTAALIALPSAAAAQIVEHPPPPPCLECPIIRPDARVAVERYEVDVRIDRQVATTHITQVLRNEGNWLAEGVYLLPLPRGAAVTNLTLWIDNEPVSGKVYDAGEARAIYEDVVRRLIDPALLEWVDHGLVQLSVFPIEPGDTRTVEVEYDQALPADAGLVTYEHPFGTEHGRGVLLESVAFNVHVESATPIKAVYSPTHEIDIERDGERSFRASFEGRDVRAGGFGLVYSTSAEDIGVDVITMRDPDDDAAGFFLAFIAPPLTVAQDDVIAKDVVLVLDRSGSMEGEKYAQARAAARFILDRLNPDDRFSVIAFSSSLRTYADRLRPASEAAAAADWLDGIAAAGATDIDRALSEAFEIVDVERPAYVIFLTDGLPTEGETNTEAIIANAASAAPANVSLFAFGVGFDVDAFLLDSLAAGHHGTADYVTPGEAIDEVVSGFYAKVTSPVLTGVAVDFGAVGAFDLHPDPLPDLFAGEQLVVAGRYRNPGTTTITLTGSIGEATRRFAYDGREFTADGGPDYVARLWATRKIGDLLRELRLEGVNDETVEQIVRLATRYGIVTPYTSYLVEEPGLIDDLAVTQGLTQDFASRLGATSGEAAVEFSDDAADLAAAEAPAPTVVATTAVGADGETVVAAGPLATAGGRTFRFVDGAWVDTGFRDGMTVRNVPFLSDEYFELAADDPAVADALALAERVVVVADGTAIRVVGAAEPATTVPGTIAATTTTPAGDSTPATVAPAAANPPSEPPGSSGTGAGLAAGVVAATLAATVALILLRRRGPAAGV